MLCKDKKHREMMLEMKKVIITAISIMTLLIFSGIMAKAEGVMLEYDGGTHEYNGEFYSLVVNNQLINPPLSPIIFNDRALVPVREIFEEVGATVNYINDTQTVEVIGDGTYVELRINDNVAYINGAKTRIPDDVVPKLIAKVGGETKTMVPVRFISESIGLDVEFDSGDGAILIESDGYKFADENQSPVPEEEFYVDPDPVLPLYITDVSCEITSSKTAKVTITTDGDIKTYSDFVLKSPDRIVLDVAGAALSGVAENKTIGAAGLSSIRVGYNEERARIVLDVTGLKNYTANQTSDNVIEICTTTEPVVATPAPATPTPKPVRNSYSNDTKLIVLDAGHGGSDCGAVGEVEGKAVYEKDLTLQITKRVQKVLEKAGYSVSMTRTGDTLPTLVERPTQANEENAALFVSIHINAAGAAEACGTEVFYAESNNGDAYGATSKELAKNVLGKMLYYMDSNNRGVKTEEHAVTKRCNMPAVLAEIGFISNPEEAYMMTTDEYQQKAAQGIAEGIMITLSDIFIPEK